MERLQKRIANNSKFSRRKAESLILEGQVKVNGQVIKELGTKVAATDEIQVGNKVLYSEEKVYYLLNKPKGVVSTCSDEKGRPTVIDLIKNEVQDNVYPVGRLDFNTTGVLILTNDGELANFLMHPRNKIAKTYLAKVKGQMQREAILQLANGIEIDGYQTSRAKIKILRHNPKLEISKIRITIYEGKNHQVKKMFEAIGGQVVELKRVEYGILDLTDLKVGSYRKITTKEVKKLYGITK
ncbi:MAG: pseudouridine synthase [Mycoplasmatales bacterium]